MKKNLANGLEHKSYPAGGPNQFMKRTLATIDKSIAQRWLEFFKTNNAALADDILAQDVIWHTPFQEEPILGIEAYKNYLVPLHAAFQGMEGKLEEEICAGDRVVIRSSFHQSCRNRTAGNSTRGRSSSHIYIFHLRGGKIAEQWEGNCRVDLEAQVAGLALRAIRGASANQDFPPSL